MFGHEHHLKANMSISRDMQRIILIYNPPLPSPQKRIHYKWTLTSSQPSNLVPAPPPVEGIWGRLLLLYPGGVEPTAGWTWLPSLKSTNSQIKSPDSEELNYSANKQLNYPENKYFCEGLQQILDRMIKKFKNVSLEYFSSPFVRSVFTWSWRGMVLSWIKDNTLLGMAGFSLLKKRKIHIKLQ